jgi:hypothetical protein
MTVEACCTYLDSDSIKELKNYSKQ